MSPPTLRRPYLSGAIVVPRDRFAPVKTCGDLFVLRSDVFRIAEDATIQAVTSRVSEWGPSGSIWPSGPHIGIGGRDSSWRFLEILSPSLLH